MPFTTFGILLWIPPIFNLNKKHSIKLQQFLYTMYMTHYVIINPKIGILTALYYYPSLYLANQAYVYNIKYPFSSGIFISFVALVIQEVFGHWLAGDSFSRLEAIPNAIMYAMYFSVSHLFI